MYYRAHYYEPQIGRFLSEDPDAGKVTKPRSFTTKYGYVLNNPINSIDPLGLFSISMKIGGGLGNAFKEIGDTFKSVGREIGNFYENNRSEIIAGVAVAGALYFGVAAVAGAVATSAAFGGAVGAGLAILNDQDPWRGALAGAAGGSLVASAVGVSVLAVGGGGLAGVAAGAAAGAGAGFLASHVGTQIIREDWATPEEMIVGTFAGAIGGAVAGAIVPKSLGAKAAGAVNDFNRSATTSGASGADFIPSR